MARLLGYCAEDSSMVMGASSWEAKWLLLQLAAGQAPQIEPRHRATPQPLLQGVPTCVMFQPLVDLRR